MSHFSYLSVLLGCLIGTAGLEIFLRTRVYRRVWRLIASVIPVVAVFTLWDIYAIKERHWTFDPRYVTGINTIGNVPIDEICFFIVIPVCAILTLEAVRSARNWLVGDEAETTQ